MVQPALTSWSKLAYSLLRLTISSSCRKKDSFACEAYSVLSKVSFKSVDKYLQGGANPGAVICKHLLKMEVVIGKDKKGNENSFCKFKDGSYIDNGTLLYYGLKNDKK